MNSLTTTLEKPRRVPVPQITQLVKIESEISALRDRQSKILENIIADCKFMDIALIVLESFQLDGAVEPAPGDVCHVVRIEDESMGRDRYHAHPAVNCSDWICELTGRTKYPKRAHVGRRYWATPQADHVVVGVETYVVQKTFGWSTRTRYVLAPTSQAKRTDHVELALETRPELVGAAL